MKVFWTMWLQIGIAGILISLASCSLTPNTGGEPAAANDAQPPADYNPFFYTKSAAYNGSLKDGALRISRVEALDKNSLRLYVHAFADRSTFVSGIEKSLFCSSRADFHNYSYTPEIIAVSEVTDGESLPITMSLILDHSGSMGERRARAIQQAAANIIQKKRPSDALSVVKYDGKVQVEVPLTTSADTLLQNLQMEGLRGFGGMTALLDGAEAGIRQLAGSSSTAMKAIILFTDGVDNSSRITKQQLIDLAQAMEVAVCAIDFGNGVRAGFLKEIADSTGGIYHKIYQTDEMLPAIEDIHRRLRSYYLVDVGFKSYGDFSLVLRLCPPTGEIASLPIPFNNLPKAGETALLNVFFDSDKAVLKKESAAAIDNIVALLTQYPTMSIELHGHTDSQNRTKDPEHNKKLSDRRADAVRAALEAKGIAANRMTSIGFGEARPIAPNDTPEGRAKNRRTEFLITKY